MRGVAVPNHPNVNHFSAASRCIARPAAPYLAATVAYLTGVKKKCKGWLSRQNTDLTPTQRLSSFKCYSHPNSSTTLTIHPSAFAHHLECQTSVMVNCIDSSFCLLSMWVPPGIQNALNEAHKAELSAQAVLMATYLDINGYNSHQCNTNSELLYLHAKMHHAKAEVEVYELAIENAPASNSPDIGVCELLVFSSDTDALAVTN
ncbi:hypothetical protein F4604DRAFT_1923197 [Suillus subluteus]|nr:hypothetical protein F4604DRAFT_1923197 [Suillus subluteus]